MHPSANIATTFSPDASGTPLRKQDPPPPGFSKTRNHTHAAAAPCAPRLAPPTRDALLDWSGMTKQQLIEAVANTSEHPKKEVEAVLDSILTEIGQALRSGQRVDLRSFGSFAVKEKKARQGRNPNTGETIEIAARNAVAFKPSKELTDSLGPAEAASQ
jgi:DNA-binding protein HU-beta